MADVERSHVMLALAQGEVYMSRSFFISTNDILDDSAWSNPVFVDEPGIDPDVSLCFTLP